MAKPSQAHEQTMEEILASIRRMIADDRPSGDRPPRPPAAHSSAIDNVSPLFAVAREEAFAVAEPVDPEPAGMDVTMTEGEDLMDAMDGEPVTVEPVAMEPPILEPLPEAAPPAAGGPSNVVELAVAEAVEEARAEALAGPVGRREPEERASAPRPQPQPAPQRAAAVSPPARPVASAAHERSPTGKPLLSPVSGAAVAGSFEQLNQSMISGGLRTVDTLVEDLLRPMLRDWLDDNLPPLVERLVRQEIERVSRGRR